MNLRDFEYVAAIDRYRNFGRAADACNVSQPALSAQIKKLEERLGVELFARTNQGVMTTEVGARIVKTSKEVIRNAQQIADTAAEYRDPFAAPLKIGIIPTLGPFAVPYMADSIAIICDELKVAFREKPTAEILTEMENRNVDIGMVSGPLELPGCKFTPVFREPLCLVVPSDHSLAELDFVEPDEIPIERLLLLTEEHCLRSDTIAICNDKNIGVDVPQHVFASNLLTMSHFVARGVGCSLLPRLGKPFLESANPKIRFIDIKGNAYARDIGFLSRIGCPREHILKALIDQIRTNLPDGVTVLQ